VRTESGRRFRTAAGRHPLPWHGGCANRLDLASPRAAASARSANSPCRGSQPCHARGVDGLLVGRPERRRGSRRVGMAHGLWCTWRRWSARSSGWRRTCHPKGCGCWSHGWAPPWPVGWCCSALDTFWWPTCVGRSARGCPCRTGRLCGRLLGVGDAVIVMHLSPGAHPIHTAIASPARAVSA
jgi:hypothetical protein